jgi:hypothetical protein
MDSVEKNKNRLSLSRIERLPGSPVRKYSLPRLPKSRDVLTFLEFFFPETKRQESLDEVSVLALKFSQW